MPKLVDTTLRLLGQEPLAGAMPTADQLRVAEILDRAGFAYLEVSGGGCFDSAVKRGVESPWERIRALKARTSTPLGLALRGRFLVGSRPVGGDFVRRFVACAADSGIDVFRLHDPLNDVSNLREAAEAIRDAEREFDAGLVYSPGQNASRILSERAGQLPELGAARVLIHDPSGSLHPRRAAELVEAVRDACGLPVGLYCQGSGGAALASAFEASRAGADLIATAVYPLALTLHRVSGESLARALASPDLDTGVDVEALWQASEIVDEHIGDEPVPPIAPRIATRAAQHSLPPGLVAALDQNLRANGSGDRLDEVLDELVRIREESGSPPLAAPIGQILASQAVINVLSATRYQMVVDELRALLNGRFGSPPGTIDETVLRAVRLVGGEEPAAEPAVDLDDVRESAEGLAASEEELLLLALFGEAAEPLLRSIRGRGRRPEGGVSALEQSRAERIREVVRLVQESGVGEITIEDGDTKVTVRRTEERAPAAAPGPLPEPELEALAPVDPTRPADIVRVEAPMVGTFYRAPDPDSAPFVQEGDVVVAGQTLCILEAMKTMNEITSEVEGRVRAILAENAQAVEYGELLFELEPLDGRPPVL
jgi:oxaloacetate decarboxylase (Na+ extruding) subunit alpha